MAAVTRRTHKANQDCPNRRPLWMLEVPKRERTTNQSRSSKSLVPQPPGKITNHKIFHPINSPIRSTSYLTPITSTRHLHQDLAKPRQRNPRIATTNPTNTSRSLIPPLPAQIEERYTRSQYQPSRGLCRRALKGGKGRRISPRGEINYLPYLN